jgi:parallel beta-helix repeat protein
VTIENSSVHNLTSYGIFVGSNQNPPSLTATVLKNQVTASGINIYNFNANASITSNVITGGYGIVMRENSVGSITSNTISNANPDGIFDFARTSHSIKSNLILNSINDGIDLFNVTNATIDLNTITNSPVGIALNCSTGNTIKNNNINDVGTGVLYVPSSVTLVNNTYNNVDIITTGCGFAGTTPPPMLPLP